jgi:hypothetical protein
MSNELDQKIDKAKEIYDKIIFLERGINYDSSHRKSKLIENHEYIIGTIEIYDELLEMSVLHNINSSTDILNYYNEGKRILTEIKTTMIEYSPELSENKDS